MEKYNSEQLEFLKEIEEFAQKLTTIEEIAILMDIPEAELRQKILDKTNAVGKAYFKGKTKTITELRKAEIELARLGSPIAIELTQKYILNQILNENE